MKGKIKKKPPRLKERNVMIHYAYQFTVMKDRRKGRGKDKNLNTLYIALHHNRP